jgi:hypothetical protein
MRLLIAFGLATLIAVPLSYAQHPACTIPLGRSSHPQTGTFTTRSTTTADWPLSTASKWAALVKRTADSTDDGLSRRHRIGGLHLTFGAIGLTGGTVSGMAAYKFFRIGGRSNSFFPKALGSMFIIPAIGFTALGIYTTIRGIRILQGKAAPVIRIPGSAPSPPPRHQSPLSVTISL